MNIPGALQSGVKSLGREDINAPMRIANAEAQAAKVWAGAVDEGAKLLGDVFAGQDEAKGKLNAAERIASDKITNAATQSYLENTPSIDLSADDVPPAVRDYAKSKKMKGVVKASDLMVGTMELQYKNTREASYEALKTHQNGAALQQAYTGAMTSQWVDGAKQAVKTTAIHQQEALVASTDRLVQEAMIAGDEQLAKKIIVEAEQSGVYTPITAGEAYGEIGGKMDALALDKMLNSAETQSDLDAAEDFLDSSRIGPEDRAAYYPKLRQQLNYQHGASERLQKKTYAEAQTMLIGKTLTRDWIVQQLKSDKLSGSQANVLRGALNKPDPLVSDDTILNDLKLRAISLRYPQEGEENVTARANQLRRDIQAQFLGVKPDGTATNRSITADDLEKLTKTIDDFENKSLGKGGQNYQVAVKSIKALTGYSDAVSKAISGPYPAGMAYSAFTAALQTYMNDKGPSADPLEFIAKNQSRFTADVYAADLNKQISVQFPQYAHMINEAGVIDVGQVLAKGMMDFNANRITEAEFTTLRRSIQYQTINKATVPQSGSQEQGANY